ncbi:MAG: hypothetical protein NT178_02565 [Proteobacteria bacterium]|nr:hypothetical protein [Pseudomonadota bacterium]
MKKIIVDIDNTLWDFATVLYERIRKVNTAVAPPKEWYVFDFWKAYVSSQTFYSIIKSIHMDQERFLPYQDAQSFLTSLKELDIHIIIASHREKGTLGATIKWLKQHSLIFDEIHLSYDKTVLFNECWAIVDDSPFTLEKATNAGIIGTGLKMPWNEHEDYPLFYNLPEVLHFLKE